MSNVRDLIYALEESLARDDDRTVEEFRDRHPEAVADLSDDSMGKDRAAWQLAYDIRKTIESCLEARRV